MSNVIVNVLVCTATFAALIYGWNTFVDKDQTCWQKHPDEMCITTEQYLRQKVNILFKTVF